VAKKTDPFPPYPEWTEAKFFSFIRSALRSASNRWPPKYQAVAAAKRPYTGENKRQKFEYQCAQCNGYFPQKEVSVDHVEPVGTLRSFDDLPVFVSKLFCGPEGLQVLCTSCHHIKTQEERKSRG